MMGDNTPKAPATTPEPPAFEDMNPWQRMKDFTRRLIAVPKTEIPAKRERPEREP